MKVPGRNSAPVWADERNGDTRYPGARHRGDDVRA